MRKSSKDEKLLVGIAFDFKNRLRLDCDWTKSRALSHFATGLRSYGGDEYYALLAGIGNSKLGAIIGLRAEHPKLKYLQTTPEAPWIEDLEKFRTMRGPAQLVRLADPIVIAAIYDIMIAEGFLKEKASLASSDTAERAQTKPWPHSPKQAMRDFLKERGVSAS